MRIRFVESTRYLATGELLKTRRLLYPALTFPLLAALTPSDISVSVAHELLEEVSFDDPADLVGLTSITNNIFRTYEIADEFRRRGVPVVMGGFHVSAEPAEALEHADTVFVGEAEDTWPQYLRDFRSGQPRRVYEAGRPPSLENLPVPRFSVLNPSHYYGCGTRGPLQRLVRPIIPVQTARGCPNACAFCDIARFHGSTYRVRPVVSVIDEIRAQRARTVCFVDDNIMADAVRARALFLALVPLRLTWFGQGTLAAAEDPELLALARRSGCQMMLVGIESIYRESLASVGKDQINRIDQYERWLAAWRHAGIDVNASMTFGFDGDPPGVFRDTYEFLVRNRVPYAGWQPLRPSPGTPFYRRLKAEGRLHEDRWWLNRDAVARVYDLKFTSSRIGRREFAEGCYDYYRRLYSAGSIVRRLALRPRQRILQQLLITLACRRRISPYAFISEH